MLRVRDSCTRGGDDGVSKGRTTHQCQSGWVAPCTLSDGACVKSTYRSCTRPRGSTTRVQTSRGSRWCGPRIQAHSLCLWSLQEARRGTCARFGPSPLRRARLALHLTSLARSFWPSDEGNCRGPSSSAAYGAPALLLVCRLCCRVLVLFGEELSGLGVHLGAE
jgi:hypothetical protein